MLPETTLDRIRDPLDNVVFALVAVSGLYAAVRALAASGGGVE